MSEETVTITRERFERMRRYIVTAEEWQDGDPAIGPMLTRLGVWTDGRRALQPGDLDDPAADQRAGRGGAA